MLASKAKLAHAAILGVALVAGSPAAADGLREDYLGGHGGHRHGWSGPIKSISLYGDERVDAIWINGHRYGGGGGRNRGTLHFDNRYPRYIRAQTKGDRLRWLEICDNMSRCISAGTKGEPGKDGNEGIKRIFRKYIVSIEPQSGNMLNGLHVKWVENYRAPRYLGTVSMIVNKHTGDSGWTSEESVVEAYAWRWSRDQLREVSVSSEASFVKGFFSATGTASAYERTALHESVERYYRRETRNVSWQNIPNDHIWVARVAMRVYEDRNNRGKYLFIPARRGANPNLLSKEKPAWENQAATCVYDPQGYLDELRWNNEHHPVESKLLPGFKVYGEGDRESCLLDHAS